MYVLSFSLLLAAASAYRAFGRRRWPVLILLAVSILWALLAAIRFGLSEITGAGLTYSVIYHLQVGLDGGDTSQYRPLVIALAVLVTLAATGATLAARRLKPRGDGQTWGNPLVLALSITGLISNPLLTDLGTLLALRYLPQGEGSLLAEPMPANLTAPPTRPNLVIVYMESLERTYLDPEAFPGLAPGLAALEEEGLHATRLGQTEGATFTVGGMVASQCGVPLILPGGENSAASSNFMTGATCLGDILAAAGYQTEYLGGADLTFGGKGAFYQSHGFQTVEGLNELKASLTDPAYLGPWGLQDDTLLDLARQRIEALAAKTQPFAFVTLTLDTHHPNGHADTNRSCQDVAYGDGSNKMLNSVACADRMLTEFVRDLQSSPAGKNTIIVLASDHLAMGNGAIDQLEQKSRHNLLIVLDPRKSGAQALDRSATTLDTGPTLLSLLGFPVPQLGLGVDLLAPGNQTLAESHPDEAETLYARSVAASKSSLDALWDKADLDRGAYVNLDTGRLDLNRSSTKLPTLILRASDGEVSEIASKDPGAEIALPQLILAHPEDAFLWVDGCQTLAFVAGSEAPDAATCVLVGALAKDEMHLFPVETSRLLTGAELATPGNIALSADQIDLRRARLTAVAMRDGALPRDLLVEGLSSEVRGVILRSAAAEHGNSLLRNQTTDLLTSGDDKTPSRGISLVRINPNGGTEVLATYDPCDPALDPATVKPFATLIDPRAIHAILVHDTALCPDDRRLVDHLSEGLDLPELSRLGFREAYLAILPPSAQPQEFASHLSGRVALRLRPLSAQSDLAATALADRLLETLTMAEPLAPPLLPQEEASAAAIPPGKAAPVPAAMAVTPVPQCQSPGASTLAEPVAEIALSQTLSTGISAPATAVTFGQGWWPAEDAGRWLGADTGELALRLPSAAGRLELQLGIAAFGNPSELVLSGPDGWSATARPDASGLARFDLTGLPRAIPLVLQLTVSAGPGCPLADGQSDPRSLSVMLQSIRLEQGADNLPVCVPPEDMATTTPSKLLRASGSITIAQDGEQRVAFGAGWWPGEPFGRWAGARVTRLRIRPDPSLTAAEIVLSGVPFTGRVIPIEVWIGNRKHAAGQFGAGRPLVVPLDGLSKDKAVDLELRFPSTAPECPASRGESADARTLYVMLQQVSLRTNAARQ